MAPCCDELRAEELPIGAQSLLAFASPTAAFVAAGPWRMSLRTRMTIIRRADTVINLDKLTYAGNAAQKSAADNCLRKMLINFAAPFISLDLQSTLKSPQTVQELAILSITNSIRNANHGPKTGSIKCSTVSTGFTKRTGIKLQGLNPPLSGYATNEK